MKLEDIMKKIPAIGKDRFLLLFLMGLLCVVIAVPTGQSKAGKAGGQEAQADDKAAGNDSLTQEETDGSEIGGINTGQTGEYGEYIEKKLEQFLTQMEGAGEVRVFVSMQSSAELVVEHNSPYVRRSEEESTDGNTRSVTELENESEVVLCEREDGSQAPIIIKRLEPSVKGIVVAAKGADKEEVRQNISEALQALFGIEEHKIKVVKLNT